MIIVEGKVKRLCMCACVFVLTIIEKMLSWGVPMYFASLKPLLETRNDKHGRREERKMICHGVVAGTRLYTRIVP